MRMHPIFAFYSNNFAKGLRIGTKWSIDCGNPRKNNLVLIRLLVLILTPIPFYLHIFMSSLPLNVDNIIT
jgi:hypothetical protein